MTRRRFALGLLLTPLTVRAVTAQESNFGGGRPEDRYFGVDAAVSPGRRGPVAEGYVTNRYDHYASRVAVTLEPVDAGGRPLGPVTTHVTDVPPRGRAFFRRPVPAGTAAVHARIAYFEWAPRGGGS
jgi:hypothetical protein